MKTALSLESQLDPAGSRGFQNHIFSMFFQASILGVFLGASFIDFFRFLVILGVHLDPLWRPLGKQEDAIKGMFSPGPPRRVPGMDLGPILGGFWWYFCVFLTLFFMFFFV